MPPESDAYLVKIVDEADNLYGFNLQSGVPPEVGGNRSMHLLKLWVLWFQRSIQKN